MQVVALALVTPLMQQTDWAVLHALLEGDGGSDIELQRQLDGWSERIPRHRDSREGRHTPRR